MLGLGLGLNRSCRNLVVFDRINFSQVYSESAHDSAHDGIFYVYILKSPCRNPTIFSIFSSRVMIVHVVTWSSSAASIFQKYIQNQLKIPHMMVCFVSTFREVHNPNVRVRVGSFML